MPALDRIKAYLVTPYDEIPLETLTEPLGQANRPQVQRRDQADRSRPAERVEGDPQSRRCSLQGVTPSPVRTSERPRNLGFRPALGIVQTHSTDECAAAELLNHPHAISAQGPMTNEHRELPPCVLPR